MDETENDDWTPLKGWMKAAIQIPLRTLAAAAVCAAILWGLYLLAGELGGNPDVLNAKYRPIGMKSRASLLVISGIIGGLIAGEIMARKLYRSTGLLPRYVALPAILVFFCGMLILHSIATKIAPTWNGTTSSFCIISSIAAGTTIWLRCRMDS